MSAVAYKLTDQDGYTRRGLKGETLWTVGSLVAPTGKALYLSDSPKEPMPCGPGVLHAYIAPEVAVLGDPIHADYGPDARLFRIETVGDGKWYSDELKRWTDSSVRVLEELPLPDLAPEELAAWAICIAPSTDTRSWAIRWLSGVDRTVESTECSLRYTRWSATECAMRAASAAGVYARSDSAEGISLAKRAAKRYAAECAVVRCGQESSLIPALVRSRSILAGKLPAEKYSPHPIDR